MVSHDYVPVPLTTLASWFSQKRQGQLSQSPHQAFQTAQTQEGKVGIRVPLAFTLLGGEAQEDMTRTLEAPEPRGWGGCREALPLAHSLGLAYPNGHSRMA